MQRPEALVAAKPVRGNQLEERGRARRAARDGPLCGKGERLRLERERESIGLDIGAGGRGGPYSFSMVHCSGCWLRRA